MGQRACTMPLVTSSIPTCPYPASLPTHLHHLHTLLSLAPGEGMSPDKTQWGEQFLGNLQPPPLSKTDDQFRALGLEFVETREGIVLPELNDLFERVRGRTGRVYWVGMGG